MSIYAITWPAPFWKLNGVVRYELTWCWRVGDNVIVVCRDVSLLGGLHK